MVQPDRLTRHQLKEKEVVEQVATQLEIRAEQRDKQLSALLRDALIVHPETDNHWERLESARPLLNKDEVTSVRKLIEFSKDQPEVRLTLSRLSKP